MEVEWAWEGPMGIEKSRFRLIIKFNVKIALFKVIPSKRSIHVVSCLSLSISLFTTFSIYSWMDRALNTICLSWPTDQNLKIELESFRAITAEQIFN